MNEWIGCMMDKIGKEERQKKKKKNRKRKKNGGKNQKKKNGEVVEIHGTFHAIKS